MTCALYLRAVALVRLPVVGPRHRLVELVLVVEQRVELQRVNHRDRRERLARLLPRVLEIGDFLVGDLFEKSFLGAEQDLGRAQRSGDVETGRPFRRPDLRVILRRRAGRVVHDLDAELLLEGLDDVLLEELLVLAAEAVDDERVVGLLAPDIRSAQARDCGRGCALDEVAPVQLVAGSLLCRHDRLLLMSVSASAPV